MKNNIKAIAASAFIVTAIFISCNSPAQKVQNAQENVNQANKDLDTATKEYLADIDNYKKQTADRITANQNSIDEFNERIANDKKEAKEEYEQKINVLEKKNTDMKKEMDDYKADGKEKWEIFKAEFSKSMDDLAKSFKDLTSKSSK
jgi:hypothetical protein